MMAEQNMQEFIKVLSSKAAVPGGGGACAYVAAAGMALGAMVANLTTGKKNVMRSIRKKSKNSYQRRNSF